MNHAAEATPRRLGEYLLERLLGEGGMGKVFAVSDGDSPYFTMELVDGDPFVAWVRRGTPPACSPDLERLESALVQLIEGVNHLHTQACVHRDLKPANVLVDRQGRVVVLDFGLVSDLSELEKRVTDEFSILGTPSYMAPEQALGEYTGPHADFYAIGVMLYECLTGQLPFHGSAIRQLVDKQDAQTPDPARVVADIPAHLRSLCVRLLAADPVHRPCGPELLGVLRGHHRSALQGPEVFVGRERERAMVHEAFAAVRTQQEPRIVHLRGPSGYGKSALARRLQTEWPPGTVMLRGRCCESEIVPFKGIDAVIDGLSAYLRGLPERQRETLRPAEVRAMIRMFGVFDGIWEGVGPERTGLRDALRRGWQGLRELLRETAVRSPLVVFIDDLQWGDEDTLRVLRELCGAPAAPPILWLLACRSEPDETTTGVLERDPVLSAPSSRAVELGPLTASESRQLAESLTRRRGWGEAALSPWDADAIALRSGGHPLFIAQLSTTRPPPDSRRDATALGDVPQARLEALDEPDRRLLDVLATFGVPCPWGLALRLAQFVDTRRIDELRAMGFVVRGRVEPGQAEDILALAHDRVRESVLAGLHPSSRRDLHRRIALALEREVTRHGGKDRFFAIVHHLNASVLEDDTLEPEQRLRLAEANYRAGIRALAATAWRSADDHLQRAEMLIAPWSEEARLGGSHHGLWVAISFARVQTQSMLHGLAQDVVERLLGASLSMEDYTRVVDWYGEHLILQARFAECSTFCLRALPQLGHPLPPNPSWVRVWCSFSWGWWRLRGDAVDRLLDVPVAKDLRARAVMNLMVLMQVAAVTLDARLRLLLIGHYSRLLFRHGLHARAPVALGSLAMAAASLRRDHAARRFFARAEVLADRPETSTFDALLTHCVLLVGLPAFRPLAAVMEHLDHIQARADEAGSLLHLEILGWIRIGHLTLVASSLPQLAAATAAFRSRHGTFAMLFAEDFAREVEHFVRVLTLGPGSGDGFDREVHPGLSHSQRGITLAVRLHAAMLLGDFERAGVIVGLLGPRCEQTLGPVSSVPVVLMFDAVRQSEEVSMLSGRKRRARASRLRAHERRLRTWAKRCPENAGALVALVEAERRRLRRDYGRAEAAYRHASTLADRHGLRWLVAFALERQASCAREQGDHGQAAAVLHQAITAYRQWGATAPVLRLEALRSFP